MREPGLDQVEAVSEGTFPGVTNVCRRRARKCTTDAHLVTAHRQEEQHGTRH